MNKLLLVILCIVFAVPSLEGQRLRKWLAAADSAYSVEKDYKSAIKYYQVALTYDSTLLNAKYKLAESARMYKAYELAREYYHKVINERAQSSDFPLAEYFLAGVYQQTATGQDENYQMATEYYNKFISRASEIPSNDVQKKLPIAERQLNIIQEARDYEGNASYYRDTLAKFASDRGRKKKLYRKINTPESEFGAFLWKDSIFFTSIRTDAEKANAKRNYARIFSASVDGESPAQPFTGFKMRKGRHVANMVFNTDNTRVYYCECDYINQNDTRCDLYYRDMDNGKWGAAKQFPFNSAFATTTQPAIGKDKSGNEMLFFATDKGAEIKGIKDIYYVYVQENGTFSNPIAMEAINTPNGDEMTPFFDSRYQRLYYSTDGEFTLGGADIYSIKLINDKWKYKRNLGDAVNTSYNDAFYTIDPDYGYAYLASDQPESLEYDEELEACCYDIYRIPIYNYTVEAETFDNVSGQPITDCTITRYLVDGQDSILIDSIVNVDFSTVIFPEWDLSLEYVIKVEKEGYHKLITTEKFNPEPEKAESNFKIDLFLDPLVRLRVYTFEKLEKTPLDSTNMTFIDITSSRDQMIVRDIEDKEPLLNTRYYPIDFDRTYHVGASRQRYISDKDTVSFNLAKIAYTGAPIIVRDSLYLEALPDFDKLLPDNVVPMYFDNNRPLMGRIPQVPRGDHDFGSLLETYKGRVGVYKSQLQSSGASMVDIATINTFFNRELLENYAGNLTRVTDAFVKYMENGYEITLELVGYSSPIGSSAYNFQLAERRIQCVEDFLMTYSNGKLKQYIKNGQLKIIKNPQGEKEDLDPELLRLLNDRKQGVYNYLSILERRVDITLREYKPR